MNNVVIQNLKKNYGKLTALNNVNLEIGEGMYGLLGKNGAGKTTLMRILTTILPETSGKVELCGIPLAKKREIRRIIGYLPQDFSLYPSLTVYENLDYCGILSELSSNERKARIKDILEKVNLTDEQKKKAKALSGGMKRRLGIAQAMLNNPKVLIVDEPTVGLDPEERYRFRNLLTESAKERVIILSTHIVEDIENTCTTIGILDKGTLKYNGGLEDFKTQMNKKNLEAAYLALLKGGKA